MRHSNISILIAMMLCLRRFRVHALRPGRAVSSWRLRRLQLAAPNQGWASLTVPRLREALREKGLKVSGKKDELVARLEEAEADPSTLVEAPSTAKEQPDSPIPLRRGQEVQIEVLSYGPLGASLSVLVDENGSTTPGIVTQEELSLRRELLGNDPKVGDKLSGFVSRIKEDGKVDVVFRSASFHSRIGDLKNRILERLEERGSLGVGDKSSTVEIGKVLPGASKNDFKKAIGSLFRDRLVILDPTDVRLAPVESGTGTGTGEGSEAPTSAPHTKAGKTANDGQGRHAIAVDLGDVERKILMSNLPYAATAQQIVHWLEEGGVKVARRVSHAQGQTVERLFGEDGRPCGQYLVTLASPEDVEAAVARNKDGFSDYYGHERKVYVAPLRIGRVQQKVNALFADQRRGLEKNLVILMRNLPQQASRNEVMDFIDDICGVGSVQDVRYRRMRNGMVDRKIADVSFFDADSAAIALQDIGKYSFRGFRVRAEISVQATRQRRDEDKTRKPQKPFLRMPPPKDEDGVSGVGDLEDLDKGSLDDAENANSAEVGENLPHEDTIEPESRT